MAGQVRTTGWSFANPSEGIQVIKRWFGGVAIVACACLVSLPHLAFAQQAPRGDWSMVGNSPEQSGWQKAERKLTPENVPSKFQFLWKINLGTPAKASQTYSEPLLLSRTINAQGFKDFVYVTSSDTLYAVDSELGTLLWKKEYALHQTACGRPSVQIIMEPAAVINFNARRAPNAPSPPNLPPMSPRERRLGIAAGGGGFGLKGVYVLTSDGMLHEQIATTGVDFAPAIRFLPASANPSTLNIVGKSIYASTSAACGASAGVWALNVASADYPVAHYDIPEGGSLTSMEPTRLRQTAPPMYWTGTRTIESFIRLSCQQRRGSGKRLESEGLVYAICDPGRIEPNRLLL